MRRLLECLAVAVFSLPIIETASAAVPASITVQGKLTDSAGVPLLAGPKSFNFKIFATPAGGGVPVWPSFFGEPQVLASDASGLWIALMGAISPLTEIVFADTARWLEVTVDGVTLPRVRLATGPYAHRVATVDGASGGTITSKVSIGTGHTNTGADAFVAGVNNTVTGESSTVGGGTSNTASGSLSAVGGGSFNSASGTRAGISGGGFNIASGSHSAIGGGSLNTADTAFSTIAGGSQNSATGAHSTIAGGNGNTADLYAFVGGGIDNDAADYSVVAGGLQNVASGQSSAIGGGIENDASGQLVVIAGGTNNVASEDASTVGGGAYNVVSSLYATVPGGIFNEAHGYASLAAGNYAVANHDRSFVWSGLGSGQPLNSDTTSQFKIAAQQGVSLSEPAGGSRTIRIGDIYQDNLIVAWGSITADGTLVSEFGVSSISHTATGVYRINLDVTTTGNTANNLIVSAILEVDDIPTSAATARLIYANMISGDGNSFDIFTTNGSHVAVDNQFTFIVTAR